MLAYGRSRRTLRFSYQDEKNFKDQIDLTATGELFDLHVPLPPPKPGSCRTLVTPIVKNTGSPREVGHDEARMSNSEESLSVRALEPSAGRRKLDREFLASQDSGKRPQFRLEMDLGPESESSGDENDFKYVHRSLLSGQHSSVDRKRTDRVVDIEHWKSGSRRTDRVSNDNDQRTKHLTAHNIQESRTAIHTSSGRAGHWNDEHHPEDGLSHRGDIRDGPRPQRAPPVSRIGGPRSQHIFGIDTGWSRAPFVTPDHPDVSAFPLHEGAAERMKSLRSQQGALSHQPPAVKNPYGTRATPQPVAVTPDVARRKGAGSRTPKCATYLAQTRQTGFIGRHADEEAKRLQWDDSDESTLRQAPSLIAVQDSYPPELSRIWPFREFNPVQSALYPTVSKSDRNVVVSAPTGCGKTVLLEMAIARLLHESGMTLGHRKIIYISPIKALCQQMLDDWTAKFSPLGVRLAELTSDSMSPRVSLRDLASADIILTTPEKWDSVTRRWKDHAFLVGTVALVLVDEVHTIGEERGATLEVVITRMKLVSRSPEIVKMGLAASRMRFVALSATLPNATDIGEFIGAEVFRFGTEFRPVALQTHVVGYSANSNPFLFDRGLSKHVPGLVARYSNGKPTLIFCGSKKDTETLAGSLAQSKDYARGTGSQVVVQYLSRAADEAQDPQLAKFIRKGVAIHNSGLSPGDRGLVERAFLSGSLAVLVATTTLALGVNLPARLVIVKGTNHYRGGAKGYQELPRSAILQMIGRAGRPGFDSSGVAVVMTSQANKKSLERLSSGQEAVESSLQARLLEALNSEVCQGETIRDIGEAIEWMRSTFYFIRCKKNPSFYGVPSSLSDAGLHGHMQTMCLTGLKQLRDAGVITMDEDEFAVIPSPQGVLFSRFMVRFESMKAIMAIKENFGTKDILKMCAGCDELQVPVRRAEKRLLNGLNKNVRFPPHKKDIVRTPAEKALVLLQAALGGLPLEDWTLRGEQTSMLDVSARLLACCAESLAVCGRGGGLGCAVALRLTRSVRLKIWMDAELGQLRQLPGVGDTMCVRLAGGHIVTLVDLARASSAKVDSIAGRKHPFGHGIKHAALHLLSRGFTASVSHHRAEDGKDELQVRVEPLFQSDNPFEDRYIETPDPAYAPPATGWRRFGTHFQLLAYYDPSPNRNESRNTARNETPESVRQGISVCGTGKKGSSMASSPSQQGSATPLVSPNNHAAGQGPLLLFRKVSHEGLHCAVIPPEVVTKNLTIHLWMICAGVCGMDVADVRIKPSTLDDSFLSVEDLQRIWSSEIDGNGTAQSNNGSEEGGEGKHSAADRSRWADWEHGEDRTPETQRSNATSSASSNSQTPGSTKQRTRWEGGESAQGSGNAAARGGRGKRKSSAVDTRGGGQKGSPDGLRQLDIASSFKAATQRALSDSARKRSRTSGNSPREGLSKGELGAIGVSEAEDDLGVCSGVPPATQEKKSQCWNVNKGKNQSKQPKSAGRTWSSMAKQSGSIFSTSSVGGSPGTFDPKARAMRTVLSQKGSEMNLSSLVGVDRLGRIDCGGGAGSTTPSPCTPHHAGRQAAQVGITGSSASSHGGTGSSTTSPGVGHADGHAIVDLTACLSDSPEVSNQTPHPGQDIPLRHDPVDFSAFAFDPTPPRAPAVSAASLSHLPREHTTRQESKSLAYNTPWGTGVPTLAGHASGRGVDLESGADDPSAGCGASKQIPSHFRRQEQDQQHQHQHQRQGYSVRAEFSSLSTSEEHGGAIGANRAGRSWDDVARQRGRCNVKLDAEAGSVRAPEQAMNGYWAPGANRGLAQLEGGVRIGEGCASPLSLTINTRAVSSEASSFFEKRGVETPGGFFDRRGVMKPQGRHGDFSHDTAMSTLPTIQTQSIPLQPSSTSSWGQDDFRRNCYDIPRNSHPGPSPSRGNGNEGFERENRIATPLPKRPNTSYLSATSNGVPIGSEGSVRTRDGVRGVSVSLRAQDSLNHRHSTDSGVSMATSAQAALDAQPRVLAAGKTEANSCRRNVGGMGGIADGAMVSNTSATLETENRGTASLSEASGTTGAGHETQVPGAWFNNRFTDGGSGFSWTSGFGDTSERYAETEGSQAILEPIRPATPPQITTTEGPSGKADGPPNGFGDRGNNGGVFREPGEDGVLGGVGGEVGGDVAKKLVFHEIFD